MAINTLQDLVDATDKQVYLCLDTHDYFALRVTLQRLADKGLLSDHDKILLERYNNSIIDIIDYVGESLFDRNGL